MGIGRMTPAADAFDAVAEQFDERYGSWLSVAAQRRAVRSELLRAFPIGARVLEIGAGTGEDALWLTRRGRVVLATDAAPSMVRVTTAKLSSGGAPVPRVVAAEDIDTLAAEYSGDSQQLDGAFSNFAALNCVVDLAPVGRGLARAVRPGGQVVLVLFGVVVPGEWLVQLARGDLGAAFRRRRKTASARLGGRRFDVRYHRESDVERAFAPWFRLTGRRGIGIFVPPSAAEPWISRHPRILATLERLDGVVSRPLAPLGDHVLYRLERTSVMSVEQVA
jgi:SAM-dependent methyltransferase